MSEHQGEKLKQFLSSQKDSTGKKKSLDAVAQDLGIVRSTLYYQFKKERIDLDFVELLRQKKYPFNPDDIKSAVVEALPTYGPHNGDNIYYIPIYAYGGFLQGYSNKAFLDDLEKFSLPGIHGEHFAFQVQGDSMSPMAGPGDIVISRKEEKLDWMIRGRAYVLQTIDGILLKIFERITDGKAQFSSVNKTGTTPVIPLKDIKGVYQVVKVLKDFSLGN
jgi:phage repressor protein C with HTH and peptisase S24 domain